nr:MAG TPA: hypothetical protein [Caudoviricetes sp.]
MLGSSRFAPKYFGAFLVPAATYFLIFKIINILYY